MTRPGKHPEHDLEDVCVAAHRAAVRGRAAELEAVLAKLRQLDPDEWARLEERLRAVLRCARAHPSFGAGQKAAAS